MLRNINPNLLTKLYTKHRTRWATSGTRRTREASSMFHPSNLMLTSSSKMSSLDKWGLRWNIDSLAKMGSTKKSLKSWWIWALLRKGHRELRRAWWTRRVMQLVILCRGVYRREVVSVATSIVIVIEIVTLRVTSMIIRRPLLTMKGSRSCL
jgi:hypothetical protein